MAVDLDVKSWTTADAADLYEIARWGNGYFSVRSDGHLLVHPDRSVSRSIDLKQLVDRLEMRGIDLPILLRFGGILQDRLGQLHRGIRGSDSGERVSGRLLLCLSDQGQSAAAGRRGSPASMDGPTASALEAGSKPELLAVVALADDDTPDHLQRIQGCRVHRNGDAGPEDRPSHDPGRREIYRTGVDPGSVRRSLACGRRSACGSNWPRGAGRWQASGGFRTKFGLTVSELLARPGAAPRTRHGRLFASCCIFTWAARSPTSATSRQP